MDERGNGDDEFIYQEGRGLWGASTPQPDSKRKCLSVTNDMRRHRLNSAPIESRGSGGEAHLVSLQ